MLRIMAIGDVTSPKAAEALADKLWEIRKMHRVDFVSVNAENAGFIMGPSPETAKLLLSSGADVLTGGNHSLQNNRIYSLLDESEQILRPLNLPDQAPGAGYTILDANGYRILVVNAMGRAMIEPPVDSPFSAIEKVLTREEGNYDIALLDFHAEASGEKVAVGMYFDGKFAAVFGTHTHVPTADLTVLPNGTGYVTDLGMCGASGGVLGIDKETVIKRYLTALPIHYAPACGSFYADAVIFTVDESTAKTVSLERVVLSL